ncbi:hypothetical protein [Nostoc sp.]|uniref:hypothetical protein n=1 Tax=Nostoc sp. TaxID=1180 RepID=UPI002FF6DDD3
MITKGDLSESFGLFNYNDFDFWQFSNIIQLLTEFAIADKDKFFIGSLSIKLRIARDAE